MSESYMNFAATQKQFVSAITDLVEETKKANAESSQGVYIENINIHYDGDSLEDIIEQAKRISTIKQ